MANQFSEGFWRLADPKISIISAASMAIGASSAARDGSFSWYWLGVLGWSYHGPPLQLVYRNRPVQPLALLAFVLLSAGITAGVLLAGV